MIHVTCITATASYTFNSDVIYTSIYIISIENQLEYALIVINM